MASRSIGCTSGVLKFPRRNPLSLLILIIPFVILIYSTFDIHNPLRVPRTYIARPLYDSSLVPPDRDDTRVLLVSSFYPTAKSRHSIRDDKHSLSLFLSRITTDIYLFTPADWEPVVREIRGNLPIHINTTFSSSFDIPPLRERRRDYERMREKDRARHLHTPEHYAVLTHKPYFLKEGVSNAHADTGRKYKYAFWVDAATFRHEHVWRHWPALNRIDDVWTEGVQESGTKAQDLVFFPLEGLPHSSMSIWSEGMGPIGNRVVKGSFFGGMPDAIDWWYKVYFAYHDHWIEKGYFVGNDESLTNALLLLYPSRIFGVWPSDPAAPAATSLLAHSPAFSSYDVSHPPPKLQLESPLGQCFDYESYHVFFVGAEAERGTTAGVWLKSWRWMWPWEWVTQVNVAKEPCRLTRVLPMERTLKRVFGATWTPPETSLTIG